MSKYPNIVVPMEGEDGNAFAILARVRKAMRRANLSETEWWAFHAEATCEDYNNLLATVARWFSLDDGADDDIA